MSSRTKDRVTESRRITGSSDVRTTHLNIGCWHLFDYYYCCHCVKKRSIV